MTEENPGIWTIEDDNIGPKLTNEEDDVIYMKEIFDLAEESEEISDKTITKPLRARTEMDISQVGRGEIELRRANIYIPMHYNKIEGKVLEGVLVKIADFGQFILSKAQTDKFSGDDKTHLGQPYRCLFIHIAKGLGTCPWVELNQFRTASLNWLKYNINKEMDGQTAIELLCEDGNIMDIDALRTIRSESTMNILNYHIILDYITPLLNAYRQTTNLQQISPHPVRLPRDPPLPHDNIRTQNQPVEAVPKGVVTHF